MSKLVFRKAEIKDIKGIHSLVNQFAKKDLMLARSLNQLYESLRDFWVCLEKNKIVACCALHVSWMDLTEIKSLAVERKFQNQGIGSKLISLCIKEAKAFGARRIFALTYNPKYFRRFGFKTISNDRLPHKIWAECINCHKFPDCKEVAIVKFLK